MSATTLKTALKIFRNQEITLAENAEWYESMARENAKKGYRPEYCRHGAYLWVDWDVICGRCEEGDPTPEERRANAIYAAKQYEADVEKFGTAYAVMSGLGLMDTNALIEGLVKLRERHGLTD